MGDDIVELAALAGLHLDPWQQDALRGGCAQRPDGRWAAFEVGLEAPRQNGKNAILEARELGGLFLLGERLIIHSAHEQATALESLERMVELIDGTPELRRRLLRVSRAHGEEAIRLGTGQRIRYRTRTKVGGRGFTGDLLVLDEAMALKEEMLAALLPTLAARPNAQVWMAGSAVDQARHPNGRVFARLRARARARDPRVCYFGWGAGGTLADAARVADDRDAWARANPALGTRITEEYIASERGALDLRSFAVERLGIGDWPALDEDGQEAVIAPQAWAALRDDALLARLAQNDGYELPLDPVCVAVDVTPAHTHAAVGIAGRRADGLSHVEIVAHRPAAAWVADFVADLVARHRPAQVVVDEKGPAAALVPSLQRGGVEVRTTGTAELAQACTTFHAAVLGRTVRHLGTPELENAVRGAGRRQLADSWAWSRRSSQADISPLVAVTLALWALDNPPPRATVPAVARIIHPRSSPAAWSRP